MAAASDPKDDVDRLFACFKCGVSPPRTLIPLSQNLLFCFPILQCLRILTVGDSARLFDALHPPESAFRERPLQQGKKSRVSPAPGIAGSGGGSSSVAPTPDAAVEKVRSRHFPFPVLFERPARSCFPDLKKTEDFCAS